jgi:hypothetical protein
MYGDPDRNGFNFQEIIDREDWLFTTTQHAKENRTLRLVNGGLEL